MNSNDTQKHQYKEPCRVPHCPDCVAEIKRLADESMSVAVSDEDEEPIKPYLEEIDYGRFISDSDYELFIKIACIEARIDELKRVKRNNRISAEHIYRIDRRITALESQKEGLQQ